MRKMISVTDCSLSVFHFSPTLCVPLPLSLKLSFYLFVVDIVNTFTHDNLPSELADARNLMKEILHEKPQELTSLLKSNVSISEKARSWKNDFEINP